MAWAAASARLPLVLLEQNAFPGRVTRWFAPRAALICTAFAEARPYLKPGGPVRVTGNPIRGGFLPAVTATARPTSHERQLLILGGSGGSRTLNEQVPRALYKAQRQLLGWRIVHQTGPRDSAATANLYRKLDLDAIVVPFIDRMQSVLQQTDLAVCRSGGTTLAELAAAGVPALLLPWPKAANNHQRANAEVYAAAGAAQMLDAREVTGRLDNAIAGWLAPLLHDPARREQMASAIQALARPNAAWHVAVMINQLLAEAVETPLSFA
jgi:UDP-N-acetylglucosamine--N-acetylmuramyl-(pentapeptide) pyrophosphoryl-undecaprenol N-acetylglucosamine transferase